MFFFTRIPPDEAREFFLFSTEHLVASVLSVLVIILIYHYLPYLKGKSYEPIIRYSIILYLFFSTFVKWSYFYQYQMPWYSYLPNATCGFAILFAAITLITKNRITFLLTFFWGWGAFFALLVPNMMEGPDRYYFYQFFVRHILIVVSGLYMIRVFNYKVYKKDVYLYWIVTGSLALLGLGLSYIVNDVDYLNMFYMMKQPIDNAILYFIFDLSHVLYVVFWLFVSGLLGYLYGLPFYTKKVENTM